MVTFIVVAGITLLVISTALMFVDPMRIGKERGPMTAGDYRWNLMFYLLTIIVCIGTIYLASVVK